MLNILKNQSKNMLFFYFIFFAVNLLIQLKFSYYYSLWTDRDLIRGLSAFSFFEPLGAELSFYTGDRNPGGFMNYLWGGILAIFPSVWSILIMETILVLGGYISLAYALTRKYSQFLIIPLLTLLHFELASKINSLWNPSMAMIFILYSLTFLLLTIFKDDRKYLKYSFLFCFIATQMHLSASILLINLIFYSFMKKISIKEVLYILGFFVLTFGLYFIYEYQNDFINSTNLIQQLSTINLTSTIIIQTLAVFFILLLFKGKKMSYLITGIFFAVIALTFIFSDRKVYVEEPQTSDVRASKVCAMEEFSCLKVKSASDLSFLIHNEQRISIFELIKNNNQPTFLITDNFWNREQHDQLEKIKMFVETVNGEHIVAYAKFGYIQPFFNFNNVKAVLSTNIFPFAFFLIAFPFVLWKNRKNNSVEQDLLQLIMIEILVYIFIYCRSFNIHLGTFSSRYLITNLIYLYFFLTIFSITVFELFKEKNWHEKFKLYKTESFLHKQIVKNITIVSSIITLAFFYSTLDFKHTPSFLMIDKIAKQQNTDHADVLFKLGLYDNEHKHFFYYDKTVTFFADPKNEYINKKSDYCYIASYKPLDEADKNILDFPRNVGTVRYYRVINPQDTFTGEKVFTNEIVKFEEIGRNVINGFLHNDYIDAYIYKVTLKEPDYCFYSAVNRYAFTKIENLELSFYKDKKSNNNRIIDIDNEKILQQKHGDFVYSLVFTDKNLYLSSNQLRGISYNLGFLDNYTVLEFNVYINNELVAKDLTVGTYGAQTPLEISSQINSSNLKKGDIVKVEYLLKYKRYDKKTPYTDTFVIN